MRIRVQPGGSVRGQATVPGDKSIAHRWLILGALAHGSTEIRNVPSSLDVSHTATALQLLTAGALEGYVEASVEHQVMLTSSDRPDRAVVRIAGRGRAGLAEPGGPLLCGNSGTTMRLLAGVLAAAPFRSELRGDESLSRRPMERVADPLRAMGAEVRTTNGCPPLVIEGGELRGIEHRPSVPSAQVKSAVLLAGLAADGPTTVIEPARTRDHTERALEALGAPVRRHDEAVTVQRFQHAGFAAEVPGDVSGAAFLIGAALVAGGRSAVSVDGVGLNPTRTAFVHVLERMGARVDLDVTGEALGEPVGAITVRGSEDLHGTTVPAGELPLVIDEVPVLAAVASRANGTMRFEGAGELRVKESDRLTGLAQGLVALGGHAAVDGDVLVVEGEGLRGGRADAQLDHRLAMAFTVAALGAAGPCEVEGLEWAEVSFPGFAKALVGLGMDLEVSA